MNVLRASAFLSLGLAAALGAWGGALGKGAVPDAPPRPQGVERNVVITQWAWGDGYTYAHDDHIDTALRNIVKELAL